MGSISNLPNQGVDLFRGCPLCGFLVRIELLNGLRLNQNTLVCPRCHGLPVAEFTLVHIKYKIEDQS